MDANAKGIEKDRQVKQEITILSEMVACVTELVGSLIGRLSPVLRDTPPPDREDAKAEELVEIADNIRSIRYVVESQRDALQSALGRLEI